MAGKKIAIVTGQTMTFGRAVGRAEFALPQDTFMSGVHFAVECKPGGCRVQDRKSSNGTFLNGAKIQDAMLANGDEIKGGQTIFAVKIMADAKLASLIPPQEIPPASASQPPQRTAEPAPPAVVPGARLEDERGDEHVKAAPEPPPSMRSPGVEPPASPQAMRTADLEAADRRSAHELRAQDLPPMSQVPGKLALPPGAGAKPPRISEPPPGVAPYIAEKFGNNPAARGVELPRGAAFSVMGWSFPAAPAEWLVQEGFGLQQSGHEEFPSSVAATEELLGGITLQQFVESQISMLRGYLRDPKIEPTMPPRVGGADESMAMDVRHSTKDGRELVYRRIYARSGSSVGVLTVTTLAADFPQVLQSLQPLLDGAAFRSTVNN